MKNGEIAYLAFTEKGRALAETLRAVLGGEVSCTRDGVALQEWTARAFPDARALVFIGAAGIAVRAIAPYLHGKWRWASAATLRCRCCRATSAGPTR